MKVLSLFQMFSWRINWLLYELKMADGEAQVGNYQI